MAPEIWLLQKSQSPTHCKSYFSNEFVVELFSEEQPIFEALQKNSDHLPSLLIVETDELSPSILELLLSCSRPKLLILNDAQTKSLDILCENVDFLFKPFQHEELFFRAQRLLKGSDQNEIKKLEPSLFKTSFDRAALEALTFKELQILRILEAKGKMGVSRPQLIAQLWENRKLSSKVIDVHICNLRKKLKALNLTIIYDKILHCYRMDHCPPPSHSDPS